jgi:hypothetical protein
MSKVEHTRGDTWERGYIIKDAAGVPLDLTGASVDLQVRDGSGLLVADLSTACTITPLAGRIDLVAPASTMDIPLGAYRFDIRVTYAGGRVKTYDASTLTIIRHENL